MAESYHRLSGYNAVSPHDGFPKAREAALKAIELDPTLAEAHAALAITKFFYEWNWNGAENEFRKAIELNPNSAEARQMFGYYLSAMGRFDAALTEMRLAHELDPLSVEKALGVGEILYLQRKYDEAIDGYRKALEIEPNSGLANWAMGRALLAKGSHDDAIAAFQDRSPFRATVLTKQPNSLVLTPEPAVVAKPSKSLRILRRPPETDTSHQSMPNWGKKTKRSNGSKKG